MPASLPEKTARLPAGSSASGPDLRVLNVLISCLIITFPVYLLPSGGPQLSTIFGVLVACLVLPSALRLWEKPQIFWGILFVFYTLIVNAIYDVTLEASGGMLKFSAFYVYNLALFIAIMRGAEQGDRFFDWVYGAVLVSVGLQIAMLPVLFDPGTRNTLFFNNPNQLGYWALLCACIIAFINLARKRSLTRLEGVALFACLILVAISQSKAAIAGMGILLVVRLVSSLYAILAAIIVGLVGTLVFADSSVLEGITGRLSRIGLDEDDTILGRGYGRIFAYPGYVLFGAGEGEFSRFGPGNQLELHSVPAMLLFCYGIPGTVLLILWLRSILQREVLLRLTALSPLGIYLLTHQGLRFSLLWIFMAVLAVMSVGQKSAETSQVSGPSSAQALRARVLKAKGARGAK